MDADFLVARLHEAKEFFDRSTSCLTEEDSSFTPAEGMMTVASQVAHVAQTIDWFFDGAFSPDGFDMEFEAHIRAYTAVTSLTEARKLLDASFANAEKIIRERISEMNEPLPEGPVMGGEPRAAIIGGISDHTAHHRGALTVYARLRGHEPPMPYM